MINERHLNEVELNLDTTKDNDCMELLQFKKKILFLFDNDQNLFKYDFVTSS